MDTKVEQKTHQVVTYINNLNMTESLHLKINADDKRRLEAEAKTYRLPLSSYVRLKLMGYQPLNLSE